MISAMIAMVRVFMRTFPSRVWALLTTPNVASIILAMADISANFGLRSLCPGFGQRGGSVAAGSAPAGLVAAETFCVSGFAHSGTLASSA